MSSGLLCFLPVLAGSWLSKLLRTFRKIQLTSLISLAITGSSDFAQVYSNIFSLFSTGSVHTISEVRLVEHTSISRVSCILPFLHRNTATPTTAWIFQCLKMHKCICTYTENGYKKGEHDFPRIEYMRFDI